MRRLLVQSDRFAKATSALLQRRGADLAGGIRRLADLMSFQLYIRTGAEKTPAYLPQFLHAIEDASVPWRSRYGRTFYRIRIGLVCDNVRAWWPCKYRLPLEYERLPHVRNPRKGGHDRKCR